MTRKLSVLEFTALGIVWKFGPCTAYSVMRHFAGSQGSTYRSGAGSIYPLLKRLQENGLLETSEGDLTVTPEGDKVLGEWILEQGPVHGASSNLDPIRSVVYFLGVLSPEKQQEFLANSLAALSDLLEDAKRQVDSFREAGQELSALAMRGVVLETEARIVFLTELQSR